MRPLYVTEEPDRCDRCGRRSVLVRRRHNHPGRPCLCPTCNDDAGSEALYAYA
jgi:hypothetical protein